MKPRLAILLVIAVGLGIWAAVDWRSNHPRPSIGNLDFVPIVRGLKPVSSYGELQRGRIDTFHVNRPFEELRAEMRQMHWKETNGGVFSQFTASSPTGGYAVVTVNVLSWVFDFSRPKGWCEVDIIRRIRPISSAEQARGEIEQKQRGEINGRIARIRETIRVSHKLPRDDRHFLVQTVDESGVDRPPFTGSMLAGLTLTRAENEHLFPRPALLSLFEKNLDGCDPREARVWLGCYEQTLQLSGRADQSLVLDSKSLREKGKSAKSLDAEERSFVQRAMSSNANSDAAFAGELFVSKTKLPHDDVIWIESLVDERLRGLEGDVRLFWECVRRAIEARNKPAT